MPRLRFPEFQDAGEWQEKQLGNVCDVRDGTHDSPKFYSTGKPLVTSKNLLANGSLDLKNVNLITEEDYEQINKRSKVDVGDILFGMIGTIGNPVMVRSDGYAIKNVALIKQQYELLNCFLVYLLNSPYIVHKFSLLNAGNTQKFVALGQIRNLIVPVPSESEQRRIADCLASLDDLIAAHSAKLDALKAHKRGLLQQLFPAEGETVPRLRFPEFADAGEWEGKKLGQIGDVLMCKRIFAEETNSVEGVPFFKIGTLGGEPDAFISKQLFDEYRSRYNFPRKGEILITCSGTVGKCLVYDGKDSYYQDSNIVWIDNPTLEVGNQFLYNLLLNVDWGRLNSTTITRIYGSDLRNLSITFPINESEQRRIADCLASIDEQIAAQAQKLDALKAHKKGLMQQLFPAPDEVQA